MNINVRKWRKAPFSKGFRPIRCENGKRRRGAIFATPLLFLFDVAALAHLYALWYFWPLHGLPGTGERLQCAALAVGLVLCIYGRFLPAFPPGSRWGIKNRASCVSGEAWKAVQKAAARRLMTGGFLLILPCLFLPGAPALATALLIGGGAVAGCYLVKA